ncbi:hypothetical protein GCM10023169_19570 [Georgenia halophila]|uniref:Uncharacterized protein n=1 Tax=Georgenia halophila TaxID=620889 RepID=A0ABP8L728_9MICO
MSETIATQVSFVAVLRCCGAAGLRDAWRPVTAGERPGPRIGPRATGMVSRRAPVSAG